MNVSNVTLDQPCSGNGLAAPHSVGSMYTNWWDCPCAYACGVTVPYNTNGTISSNFYGRNIFRFTRNLFLERIGMAHSDNPAFIMLRWINKAM